jgi:hypothetical protein
MRVSAFQPEGLKPYRLANRSGVGRVSLSKEGVPVEICLLPADGGVIRFLFSIISYWIRLSLDMCG